ncbi:MAG: hypothetical protein O2820_12470 [Planctomycetota bacterium]|nr:hypothetical protein [Planctomycetota bacterium]MDA1250025.1 hypothetical protein [Planctomycetota bacterium]
MSCASGLVFVLAALVWFGLRPHYEGITTYGGNTDDVRSTMFVSGACVPGGPSADLLYSNRLIGLGLSRLYSARPDVPWYRLYLTGCHLLAHFAICFAWCRVAQDTRTRIAVVAFCVGMGSYFWVALQFTTTSTLMALAGVSLLASAILEEGGNDSEKTKGRRISTMVTGWGFVILSGLIRWHAVLLMGVVCFPIGIVLAVSCWKTVAVRKHLILAAAAIGVMIGLQAWSQRAVESSPEWSRFKEFERPMASLINNRFASTRIIMENDKKLSGETQQTLDSTGWSHNDARLFYRWLYFDETVYSPASIGRVNDQLLPAFPDSHTWLLTTWGIGRVLLTDKLILLAMLLSGAVAAAGSNRVRLAVIAVWLAAILLTTAVYLLLKMPPHVLYSITSGAFFTSLSISVCGRQNRSLPPDGAAEEKSESRLRQIPGALLIAASVSMAAFLVFGHFKESQCGLVIRDRFLQSMSQLKRGPDHICVSNPQFPFERVSPFDTMSDWHDLQFLYTDGDTRSPRYHQFLRENGIDDLMDALYRDDRVRLICPESRLPLLVEFLREHRGVEVEWSLERKLPYIPIYRLTEKHKEAE